MHLPMPSDGNLILLILVLLFMRLLVELIRFYIDAILLFYFNFHHILKLILPVLESYTFIIPAL